MSFEGYVEKICINGHYTSCDVHGEEAKLCPHCNATYEPHNVRVVDTTNGSDQESGMGFPTPLRTISPAQYYDISKNLEDLLALVRLEAVRKSDTVIPSKIQALKSQILEKTSPNMISPAIVAFKDRKGKKANK